MRLRQWTAVALLLLTCVGFVTFVVRLRATSREPVGPPNGDLPNAIEGGPEPAFGQFVGHSESSIVVRFGPPSNRWKGHYAAPPISYRLKYPDAITATFVRPSGVLYLSFCREEGRLVCFSSAWMPEGWAF
jgi:hypothetical protein